MVPELAEGQEELIAAKVLPSDYDFQAHKELVPIQPGDVPVTFADTTPLEHKNSSKNITAIINIILLIGATAVSSVVYFCEQDKAFVKAIWTGVLPIVTLSLGYLFGKK